MGSVPRSPSHSERRAGQPRLPPSPGHLGSGGCLDTRAGGRGDLCLPEDRGRSHCPLRTPWAVGGAWVPASLGLNCQLQSASASQSVRQCGPGSRLPACPPQGSEPSASLLRRGAVGGALLGWGNRPGPRGARQLRSLLKGFTPQDCPFAYNSRKRLQLRPRTGRGLHCREDSRAWESNRAGRVVILTACSLPVGRRLARSRFLAHKGACARAVVQQQAGAELPAVEICAFNEGRRRGDPRWQARGLLSTCKTPMATSGHRWQSRCCFCGMEGHGVTSRTFSTPRAR